MNKQRTVTLKPGETLIIRQEEDVEWYSITNFAKAKNIARSTLYCKIKNGEIVVDKSQNKPRINRNQLNK